MEKFFYECRPGFLVLIGAYGYSIGKGSLVPTVSALALFVCATAITTMRVRFRAAHAASNRKDR